MDEYDVYFSGNRQISRTKLRQPFKSPVSTVFHVNNFVLLFHYAASNHIQFGLLRFKSHIKRIISLTLHSGDLSSILIDIMS